MDYFAECLEKFQDLTDNAREAFGGVMTYAILKEIEDKYKVKLSFLVILLAIGELENEDIEEYLILEFKIAPDVAKKIKEELVSRIIDPANLKSLVITEPRSSASKDDIINLFTKRIVETLKADPEIIAGLNVVIFEMLGDEKDLEDKIISLLYNNNEILTSGMLIYEDREVSPTVANWLKDFIKTNGSETFDELVLAQYLSTSVNAKRLSPDDKDLLRKLLKLYRNLVFFPESMDNIAVEDWQIFPFIKTEKKIQEFKDVLSDETPEKKINPIISKPVSVSRPVSTPKPEPTQKSVPAQIKKTAPVEEKKEEDNPLAEFQKALTQYTPGSLEYKAVAQEIERLKKKKK